MTAENDRDTAAAKAEPIDRGLLLRHVEGDLQLLDEIASLFFTDYPRRLSELHEAIARHDSEAVFAAAHSIKGSVASLAAQPSYEAAQRLEQMGRSGDLRGVGGACARLQAEVERLKTALTTLRDNASNDRGTDA